MDSNVKELVTELRAMAAKQAEQAEAAEKAVPRPDPIPAEQEDPNEARWARRQAFLEAGLKSAEAEKFEQERAIYGPGLRVGRIMRAVACSQLPGLRPELRNPVNVLADLYKDKATAALVEKALAAGTPAEGGYLVPEILSDDVIELLRAQAVIFKLGAREVPMPAGNLTLPRLSAGSSASYVAENAIVNDTEPTFADVKYSAKKLMAIIAMSNELLRVPSASADAIVRADAVEALAEKMDEKALVGTGSSSEPLGALKDAGATDVSVAAAVDADTPTKFLKALADADVPMAFDGSCSWVFNPTIWEDLFNLKGTDEYFFRGEMKAGTLLGFPYCITSQIPNDSAANNPTWVGFGKWAELLVARQGPLEVAVSAEAAYYSGGSVVAAFGKDQSVLRLIDRHDIRLRNAAKIAKSSDVHTS